MKCSFFFSLNCVDYQRKFLKMLFRPKHACHLTLFFQLSTLSILLITYGSCMIESRGTMSVLCYWFMCDFLKQMGARQM